MGICWKYGNSIRWDMLLLGLPLLGILFYALLKNKWKNKI